MNRILLISFPVIVALLAAGCSSNTESPTRQAIAGSKADSKEVAQFANQEAQRQSEERDAATPRPTIEPAPSLTQAELQPVSLPPAPKTPASLSESQTVVAAAPTKAAGEVGRTAPSNRFIGQEQRDALRAPSEPTDREQYAHQEENPVKRAAEQPVSTFSIDVDTAAYANVRRFLNEGRLPPQDAVRVEELINYFDYDYPLPEGRQPPFQVSTELAPTPWNAKTLLLAIGIKGYDLPKTQLPPANLVFLIDVSGSMNAPDKIGLLKSALKLLVRQLGARDKVAIAVYAGAAGQVLEPTPGNQKAKIEAALEQLRAGGATNGGAGIQLAYHLAREGFIEGGINRVILATDGDFNVGTVNFEALKDLVETQRKSGVALTTLGFGTGNYNDQLMEQLADAGNGNYAYIDTLQEANKALVEQMSATLLTIAKDVKIQIEFNPARVEEYRLIGYENRVLRREDFSNDAVDAGDIGAGHTVTALYEIALKGSGGALTEPLRYGQTAPAATPHGDEIAFLRLRYKQPDSAVSQLLEWPIQREQAISRWQAASDRFRFAAAVAGFGQKLRGGRYTGNFGYDDVLALARHARGADPFGYRGEFLTLVGLAKSLDPGKHEEQGQAIR
ncbi:MAG: von Willebrand factor type A domain-containing protein [Candidatus Competibacteraceae bacterium]|nr:von Willebrand factor type A domain-containing protein [Candidatus Competibacteraceae bacterium]